MKNLFKSTILLITLAWCFCSCNGQVCVTRCSEPVNPCEVEPCMINSQNSNVTISDNKEYVVNQLVFDFTKSSYLNNKIENVIEVYMDSLLKTGIIGEFKVDNGTFEKCLCDKELYIYTNTTITKEIEPHRVKLPDPPSEESDVSFNLLFAASSTFNSQTNNDFQAKVGPASERVVAFLDSGIIPNLLPQNVLMNNTGKTGLCLNEPDTYGYNFINMNANVMDLNGHGTLSVLSFFDALNKKSPTTTGFNILPVKVLDQCGYGTSYSVACGLYYAAARDADIINLSLGYKDEDKTIHSAITEITASGNGPLLVCSAGNKGTDLNNTNNHFPSGHYATNSNVFEVGALCSDVGNSNQPTSNLAAYSNYREDFMVESGNAANLLIPASNLSCTINGTSIAAPRVTAAILIKMINTPQANINNTYFQKPQYEVANRCYYSVIDK